MVLSSERSFFNSGSELALTVTAISICCPIINDNDTSSTTFLVCRQIWKLQFPSIYRIISNYFVSLPFRLIPYPGHKELTPLLVTLGLRQHGGSSRSTSCTRSHTDLVRPHLQAPF